MKLLNRVRFNRLRNAADFETIEKDGTVTLRDRDTCEQKRVSEDELMLILRVFFKCEAHWLA